MFSKHVLGPLVILVRLMPVFLSMPQRGDLCPNYPITDKHQVVVHINYTTGRQHCCRQIQCPAGHEVKYCSENNPNDTQCVKCKHGYYNSDNQMSNNNPRCLPWANCSAKLGLIFNNDGTSISPGTCKCDVSKGYFKSKWDFQCKTRREECEPDHELDSETGNCIPCRAGHQQPTKGFGPCTPCPAETQKLRDELNCTACPLGTFKPNPGYGTCLTCKALLKSGVSDVECDPKKTPTPKVGPSLDNEEPVNGNTTMVTILVVLCVLAFLITVAIIGAVLYRRRRRELEKRRKMKNSPLHSTNPAGPNYRVVSSASSDTSSHSSAEDALEAEKVKAQNMTNQKATMTNEKLGADDVNTDYASPPGHNPQPTGQPNGFPNGYPNGYTPGPGMFSPPQEQGGFMIVNPSNCNISLGQGNKLQMTPNAEPEPKPPCEVQLNNLNKPRSRQSAPPTVDLSQKNASPDSGIYSNQSVPPYYEDEADRIAAYYEPSQC